MKSPYRNPEDAKPQIVRVIFYHGGMGDQIAFMPTVRYLQTYYPHVTPIVYVPPYMLTLFQACFPDLTASTFPLERLQADRATVSHPELFVDWKHNTTLHRHLVHHGFQSLLDVDSTPQPSDLDYMFPPPQHTELPVIDGRYIVITPFFTAPARSMSESCFVGLLDWCEANDYKAVILGKVTNTHMGEDIVKAYSYVGTMHLERPCVVNLADKTDLIQAMEIMRRAEMVVGVDNGLLHLAGLTNVTIIGGFTNVDPRHRMPYRHGKLGWNFRPVVPEPGLACRFCQTRMNFAWGIDYRKCFYDDYKCSLTAQQFIKEIESELFYRNPPAEHHDEEV